MKTLDEFLDEIENNAIIHLSFPNGSKLESIDKDKIKAVKIIQIMRDLIYSDSIDVCHRDYENFKLEIDKILNEGDGE